MVYAGNDGEKAQSKPEQFDRASLVNVAKGKPASQSSFSSWSVGVAEASQVVSGSIPISFAFHTEAEDHPWWQVDLLRVYPIERVVVHNRNRLDNCSERAKILKVEISEDSEHWLVVHGELTDIGRLFDLPLGSTVFGRYVRLSLTKRKPLSVAQVEVFIRRDIDLLDKFREKHGLKDSGSKSLFTLYSVRGNVQSAIIGLEISTPARFGNLLLQYTNAILLAEKTALRYIKLGWHELTDLVAPVSVGRLIFLPSNTPLPTEGAFVSGGFFDYGLSPFSPILAPLDEPDEIEYTRVGREIIRPYLLTAFSVSKEAHPEDELTIHIRSGDIFSGDPIVSGYRQPPMVFYTLVINKLFAEGTIRRVRLVFEDRGNPCVDAVEAFLAERGIPFRGQSGTLAEDLSALIDAPHLAFGFGTFGYAVCRLSARIKTLHFFAPELCGRYVNVPSIERVFEVQDQQGRYMRAFEQVWFNTPDQRDLMLSYPSEALEIRELK